MPMLSFSCRKEQLMSGLKIETTRLWTEHRRMELVKALANGSLLKCWWKPRTKERFKLFDAKIKNLSSVVFSDLGSYDGRPVPFHFYYDLKNDSIVLEKPFPEWEIISYYQSEGFSSYHEFFDTLAGKHRESILGKPMICILFRKVP